MRRSPTAIILIGMVVIVAATLRLPLLSLRPMHTDEAVHGVKLGQLLETGRYEYDPHEYHGPTLNALTLPIAWLRGQRSLEDLDEVTLRVVPGLFGIGVVLLPLLFSGGLSRSTLLLTMVFTALSPAMVFYSRYYIQEMLLVFFTGAMMGSFWRFIQSRQARWLILAGLSAGLMHATKETCVIAWGCMALAWVIVWWIERPPCVTRWWRPALGALAVAVVVSAMLMSWFGTNPSGVLDSIRTYSVYLQRGAGHSPHVHPWNYYLNLLTWTEGVEPVMWNEDFVIVMGGIGLLLAFFRRHWGGAHLLLIRWLALYSFLMWAVYSSLPYKTPWSILGAWQGTLILAGLAMAQFLRSAQHRWERIFLWCFLGLFGLGSPWAQSILQGNMYCDAPSNPYVYGHTHRDLYKIAGQVTQAGLVHPQGRNLSIQVVWPRDDYWPLPWTLRHFTHVGYWNQVDVNQPAGDVILAPPELTEALQEQLYDNPHQVDPELYVPLFKPPTYLRNGVEIMGLTRFSLWQKMSQAQEADPNGP